VDYDARVAVIAGGSNRYEVLAKLATGGMAEVFLARVTTEAEIERHVVLKRVLPELAHDEAFVAMFLDEVRLSAQLRHPNIAQLYDVGRLGNSYFYTMEYIHGATAWLIMQRASVMGTPIPLAHVLTVAANISAALHHAHTRVGPDRKPLGIVHRDVTPANIMVSNEGVVKLLDFGVAKAQGRRTVTQVGTVKGKIGYLSPEQCTSGATIDHRSDIFSLGICLYELLTLHQLFQRAGDLPTMNAIVHENVPPPSSLRPDVPPAIDRLVMTALAKDPAARFPTADAMHASVEDTAAALGLSTSVTALARYMTTLFGQPPEPWLALEPAPADAAVTVVAKPLAHEGATVRVPKLDDARDSAELDEKIKNMRAVRDSKLDSFDDETDVQAADRPSLPLASEHPSFASIDPLDKTTPEPKGGFEDDQPSDVQTVRQRPRDRTAVPRTVPTPTPMRVAPKAAEWNIPRLVIAGVVVVAIALVIVLWIA
jgi:serine/threonine protein kinase